MNLRKNGFVALALLFHAASAWAELPQAIHGIELRALRDFGLVMGETIRHEISVEVAKPYELEADFLPQPGSAVSDWLEVREATWKKEARGSDNLYRIVLTYQIFKGVRAAENLSVPALPLRFKQGDSSLEAEAPAWNFTLMPLIPPKTPDENVTLRGDLPPPAYPVTRHRVGLSAALAGVVSLGLYAAWVMGLPPFRARKASPFARAGRELKKLRRLPHSPEVHRAALRLVHEALNRSAGRTIFAGGLERLMTERPEFGGQRSELEAFFRCSQGLFFAAGDPENIDDFPLQRIEDLCRHCLAAERVRR